MVAERSDGVPSLLIGAQPEDVWGYGHSLRFRWTMIDSQRTDANEDRKRFYSMTLLQLTLSRSQMFDRERRISLVEILRDEATVAVFGGLFATEEARSVSKFRR